MVEEDQHGRRTGAASQAVRTTRQRRKSPKPLGHDRASRTRNAERTLSGQKRPRHLTPDEQAQVVMRYKELPNEKRKRSEGLKKIVADFDISQKLPSILVRRLKDEGKLPTRKGVGGRPRLITKEKEEELKKVLHENAYDLTFRQIQELTGIPSSTASRFMKEEKGWRMAGKSSKPLLTDANVQEREAWAKKHKSNKWKEHVDIDEKWFNVYSHSGKLKLPPGLEEPITRPGTRAGSPGRTRAGSSAAGE
ncbi:hypothetical protein AB1Y20_006133 [Prymnesium parvum]|uniref:Transposase Tc1-like domain-containing protein n=1 Tax=Prymnesium parvum TaxID=97485 RepID=A0AB34J3U1_PRYPA